MKRNDRLSPIKAAEKFLADRFPDCDGALLAGSIVRGEETEASDLDIVVFERNLSSPYRESFIDFGWSIEVFVNNLSSYKDFFESDCKRARPSLPRMVSEGLILKDNGIIGPIKSEARDLLEKGPEQWSTEMITIKRYQITDAMDDFIGCTDRAEQIMIANTIAELVSEFMLRTNNRWIGTSKWVIRSLRQYDPDFTDRFIEAFEAFYRDDVKTKIIEISDDVLEPHGGRLFDGFSMGKN